MWVSANNNNNNNNNTDSWNYINK